MFCATLSELKRAPSWKRTPNRASKSCRSSASSVRRSRPSSAIRPADGRSRPTMARSSTDFPEPEAPTTPSTSLARTSRSSASRIVRPPSLMVRPRTEIALAVMRSYFEVGEDDGEDGIGEDDEEDRLDDGARRQAPDALRAARHAQALVATGERDDAGESRRLQHADPEGPAGHRRPELAQEGRDRDVERAPGHQGAAEQAHDIGEEGDQRQRQQHGEEARQDENFDGIEAEHLHRVDLLID